MLATVKRREAKFAYEFIGSARWKCAKTMPDWPHEYTVKAWRPESTLEFKAFCALVLAEGTQEDWPPAPAVTLYRNHYVEIGPHRYWAMGPGGDGDPVEDKTVINRAAVEGRRPVGPLGGTRGDESRRASQPCGADRAEEVSANLHTIDGVV